MRSIVTLVIGLVFAAAAQAGTSITGQVSLDPALASKVAPDDTVFVFARAAQGPRMPLAMVRGHAKDLPMEFTLDDSSAMMPSMKLSNFPEVNVIARVSKSGNAMPQPGDLEVESPPVKPGTEGMKLVIDHELP